MNLSLQNVTKRFGATAVLKRVSLEIADRELFFLLGPSGCGKTTLLRLIAGFYRPDEGDLLFGNRRVNDLPPHRRNAGMVFQNYALWPHLTVAENVAYGLEVRRLPAAEREGRVAEALSIVRMEAFAARSPNQLSGGQQQRVALARALVIRPDVLLLDEPLSNLDARLRFEMREEIRRIHDATRITTVYVTHDQKESLSMADRMAVLHDGGVEQTGSPREVYRAPASRFVAEFIGEVNWVAGSVTNAPGGSPELRTDLGSLVPSQTPMTAKSGQPVWVGFRPEAVAVGSAGVNEFRARIAQVTYLGDVEQYVLEIPGGPTIKACEQNPTQVRAVGEPLVVHVRPENLFLLPRNPAGD